jgi:hypothetical protein
MANANDFWLNYIIAFHTEKHYCPIKIKSCFAMLRVYSIGLRCGGVVCGRSPKQPLHTAMSSS